MSNNRIHERLSKALETAKDAFWGSIAASFPEVRSGDLCPGDALAFDQACEKVAQAWLTANAPPDAEQFDRLLAFARKVAHFKKWGTDDAEMEEPSDGVDDSHTCLMDLIDEAREIVEPQQWDVFHIGEPGRKYEIQRIDDHPSPLSSDDEAVGIALMQAYAGDQRAIEALRLSFPELPMRLLTKPQSDLLLGALYALEALRKVGMHNAEEMSERFEAIWNDIIGEENGLSDSQTLELLEQMVERIQGA